MAKVEFGRHCAEGANRATWCSEEGTSALVCGGEMRFILCSLVGHPFHSWRPSTIMYDPTRNDTNSILSPNRFVFPGSR